MAKAFLHARVSLHWGFVVRQLGASAAQMAYVLPPPPTVIGSFANPLARLLGAGESIDPRAGRAGSRFMACALEATLAAGAGLEVKGKIGVAVYGEPSRITATLYKGGTDYRKALKEPPYLAADRLLPVQAVGAASAPSARLDLAWLLDVDKLVKCLGPTALAVDEDLLAKAAWSIYRVGSREGLATVEDAGAYSEGDLTIIGEGGSFKSVLYQPRECVNPTGITVAVTLYNEDYREASYYVPSSVGGPSVLSPPREPGEFVLKSMCRAAAPKNKPELALAFKTGG